MEPRIDWQAYETLIASGMDAPTAYAASIIDEPAPKQQSAWPWALALIVILGLLITFAL